MTISQLYVFVQPLDNFIELLYKSKANKNDNNKLGVQKIKDDNNGLVQIELKTDNDSLEGLVQEIKNSNNKLKEIQPQTDENILENLIGKAKLLEVIEKLNMLILPSDFKDELIILQMRYYNLIHEKMKKIITTDRLEVKLNEIGFALLHFIRRLKEENIDI